MKKLILIAITSLTCFAQVFYGPPSGQGNTAYSGGGAGTTYIAGTGISISGGVISATGTNVAVVIFDSTQFTTNGSGALEIINGALITNIVVTAITNTSLTASLLMGTDATKKEVSITTGTGLNLSGGNLTVTTIGATAGSMINSGASLATAIPEYNDTFGTNIVPSKILIVGLTNISLGSITITNKATADNIVVTNGVVAGSITNNSLTASLLMGTDSTKKEISITPGDGLTNSANTLKIAITAGANITLTTNSGNITIAGAAGGGGGTSGTVINTGASVANQVPVYNDITGTNVVPSNVTISSKTNLATGTLTVTNNTTFGDGTTVALETYPIGGTITNAANNVGLTNAILSVFNSNVIFQASITNNSLTASQLVGTDSTKKEQSVAIGNGLTNAGGTSLSVALTAGANITFTTNNGNISIAGAASGSGAIAGTVLNSGASIATALPEYADTSGTNIVPSKILINNLTNESLGSITITNQATADNIVVTNGVVVGSLTNNSLTASKLMGTDATKKAISISVGDGLTNSANTLSWAVAAGSGITLTTNNGQVTITSTSGGGGTVTATAGSLTANSVVLGAGSTDTKVVAGVTTDGTSVLNLGVAGISIGGISLKNATSGAILINPPTGALGAVTLTAPAITDTLVTKTSTDTLQNKTEATTAAGGNNTFTTRKTLALQFTRVAITSMIINSNDFSLASYGRIRFPGNSALTNSNYAIYRAVVPIKFSSAQDLTMEKIVVKTTGTQTGAFTFNIGVLDIAESATADPADSTAFGNYVSLTSATLTSPAANDRFSKANVTLTGWKSALTAGDDMAICIVRNDTNTDGMDLVDLLISYVETQ